MSKGLNVRRVKCLVMKQSRDWMGKPQDIEEQAENTCETRKWNV